ncbi:MAG: GNAT family N-acetyltransferase [Pseudomonadota bacterium]
MTAPDLPSLARFAEASDATWRGERVETLGGWHIRFGPGAGNRACTAWARGDPGMSLGAAIDAVEAAYRATGAAPRFQLWPQDGALDTALEVRGYRGYGRSLVLARPANGDWPAMPEGTMLVTVRAPLAMLSEIWEEDGINPPRRAVIDRAAEPKACLLGRVGQRSAGAVAVLSHGDIAVVNALLVRRQHRRKGLGLALMLGAAQFAAGIGARYLAHSVSEDNDPAIALYRGLGFQEIGAYHYRVLEEG